MAAWLLESLAWLLAKLTAVNLTSLIIR